MDCRRFQDALRTHPDGLPEEARAHRSACAECNAQARAALLLHWGSARSSEQPRDGFATRLRARIAATPAGSVTGTAAAEASWADGIGLVARPALALASVALLAVLAWSGWSYTTSREDDLVLLAGGDELLNSVLVDGVDGIALAESSGTNGPGAGR